MATVLVKPSLLARVEHVVMHSGIGDFLREAVPKDPRGNTSGLSWELLILGSLLSAYQGDGHVLSRVYHLLTEQIDRHDQLRLGIRKTVTGPPTFSYDSVSRMSLRLAAALDYGHGSDPDLDEGERARRRTLVLQLSDRLLDPTLIPSGSRTFAIDGTGIWAWGRAPRQPRRGEATAPEDADITPDAEPGAEPEDGARNGHDADATWAVKTRKFGGTEAYFGYEIQAIVRTPDPHQAGYSEPTLVERIEVTSARRDTIPASVRLLERLPTRPGRARRLLVADRAYNNWTEQHWFVPLTTLGFDQVIDMRETQRRRRLHDGMVAVDGAFHCPRLPAGMEDLRAPASGATDEEWDEFHAAIERRQAYAMWWNARGLSARVGCPAVAATPTVGCPLRPGTVELAHRAGLPIVTDPPEAGIAPTCCTARTVSVPVTAWGRVWQRYYWGSRDWRRAPAPRT